MHLAAEVVKYEGRFPFVKQTPSKTSLGVEDTAQLVEETWENFVTILTWGCTMDPLEVSALGAKMFPAEPKVR